MKYSDPTRRRLLADASIPTPRSEGRKLTLTVSLYREGHSAMVPTPRTLPVLSNDDEELVAQFAALIRLMREGLNESHAA